MTDAPTDPLLAQPPPDPVPLAYAQALIVAVGGVYRAAGVAHVDVEHIKRWTKEDGPRKGMHWSVAKALWCSVHHEL